MKKNKGGKNNFSLNFIKYVYKKIKKLTKKTID